MSDQRSRGAAPVTESGGILAQNCVCRAVWPTACFLLPCGVLRVLGPDEVARAGVACGQRARAPGGQVDVGAPARHGHIFADMRDVRAALILWRFLAAGLLGASGRALVLAVHGCNSSGSAVQKKMGRMLSFI